MSEPTESAAEHLRTIRALMERATIYRAISAPAALLAGVLSLSVCAILYSVAERHGVTPGVFMAVWLGVMVLVNLFNFRMLQLHSVSRSEPFVSSGMKHALRAVAPPLSAGFLFSTLTMQYTPGGWADMAACWILFYGLALLATGSFSPRSMQALGLAFFLLGGVALLPAVQAAIADKLTLALVFMGLTFGLLHIAYAAAVMVRQRRTTASLTTDSGA